MIFLKKLNADEAIFALFSYDEIDKYEPLMKKYKACFENAGIEVNILIDVGIKEYGDAMDPNSDVNTFEYYYDYDEKVGSLRRCKRLQPYCDGWL